jgi:hypothetical protein
VRYSLWSTSFPDRFDVSASSTEPRPVIGTVIQREDGLWVIDGLTDSPTFALKEQAAAWIEEHDSN